MTTKKISNQVEVDSVVSRFHNLTFHLWAASPGRIITGLGQGFKLQYETTWPKNATFSGDEEVLGVGVTREGWLEVVLGGKRLVARTINSLLGGPTHVYLALARGNTAVKVI